MYDLHLDVNDEVPLAASEIESTQSFRRSV